MKDDVTYIGALCDFSIDATEAADRLGRYINDSPDHYANCVVKPHALNGVPKLFITSRKDIKAGTELRYNYNGGYLPWRKVCVFCTPKSSFISTV